MTKLLEKANFILLGQEPKGKKANWPNRVVCQRAADIGKAIANATSGSIWVALNANMAKSLLKRLRTARKERLGNMLALKSPEPEAIDLLRPFFMRMAGGSQTKWLPMPQLAEVLSMEPDVARDLFIGGEVNRDFGFLTLFRGDFKQLSVPLAIFKPSGTSEPDFDRFELDDHGYTVRFGEYEASANFVLYEMDSNYRARMKATRTAEERSFGASLRRLRISRRLKQRDFPGVTEKTIGRIERGESKPHGSTLKVLAETLGVEPEEIETY